MVSVRGGIHVRQEFFVVGNDNKLKVPLFAARRNDERQGLGEGFNVIAVKVGGGLVEGNEPAVDAKALRQREPDDDWGKHFLARGAAPAHVELNVLLNHAYAVVVFAGAGLGSSLAVGPDQDRVNIGSTVGFFPKLDQWFRWPRPSSLCGTS